MPRKHYDNKPFAYRIAIFDRETYDDEFRRRKESKMRMVVESIAWKREALDRMKMYLSYQIVKLRQQIKRPWYCYYTVYDYGAPGSREFLCPYTSMKARRIKEKHAFIYRRYYADCINASKLMLNWLCDLPPYEYTFELHQYLLRFCVTSRPHQHYINEYEERAAEKISRALR
jgi:hypothetical protein